MMRVRSRIALLAVVCGVLGGPAFGQVPPPLPASAGNKSVVIEARWVSVPAGFCDRDVPNQILVSQPEAERVIDRGKRRRGGGSRVRALPGGRKPFAGCSNEIGVRAA